MKYQNRKTESTASYTADRTAEGSTRHASAVSPAGRAEDLPPRRLRALAALLLSAAVLTGCGAGAGAEALTTAEAAMTDRDYTTAVESYRTALSEGGSERAAWRGIGIAYNKQGMYDESIDALLHALAKGNGIPDAMDYDTDMYLADSYTKTGDTEAAKQVYDAILELKPNDREAMFLRGVIFLREGRYDQGMTDFRRVIELQSKDYDMLIRIYQALREADYEEQGRNILQSAMNQAGQDMSNYDRGQLSFYLGNNADAQNYLERAREESGADKKKIVLLLGQTGEKQGDYNYAIGLYQSYLQSDPTAAEIYNRLGICEVHNGSYEAAIAHFETGLKLGDQATQRQLMRNQITAYEYAGQFTQAKALMQRYLSQYPDDAEAERENTFLSTRE